MKLRTILLFGLLLPFGLSAQKGHFIGLAFGPQMVGLSNAEDVRHFDQSGVSRNSTFRWAAGLDYYYNFGESYGLQTGVYFSRMGQKYSGLIGKDANTGITANTLFESHIFMDYLRVPLIFRFNSLMEEDDRMNLTIFAGISFNYFLGVTEVGTDPAWPDSMEANYQDFDFDKLYKKGNMAMTAGAQFNIRASETIYPFFGIRFDRGLASVEDLSSARNIKFGRGGAPVEWTFPVSTKKEQSTDLFTRTSTKLNAINVFVGMAVKFGGKDND